MTIEEGSEMVVSSETSGVLADDRTVIGPTQEAEAVGAAPEGGVLSVMTTDGIFTGGTPGESGECAF